MAAVSGLLFFFFADLLPLSRPRIEYASCTFTPYHHWCRKASDHVRDFASVWNLDGHPLDAVMFGIAKLLPRSELQLGNTEIGRDSLLKESI